MGEMSESETDSQSGSRVRFAHRHRNEESPTIAGMSSFEEAHYDGYDEEEQEIRFDEEGDEEVYVTGGNDSEVSSAVGSDTIGYATDSIHDYIDLTGDDVCRVIMTRQQGGIRSGCVCGNERSRCQRPGHATKQGVLNKEGPPRFYVKFPGSRGTCDGRLDRATFTQAEGERMLRANRDEMEQMAQVLRDTEVTGNDSDSDLVEDVTHLANRGPTGGVTMATPQASNINFMNRVTKFVMSGRTGNSSRTNNNANQPPAPIATSPTVRDAASPTASLIRQMDAHSLGAPASQRYVNQVSVGTTSRVPPRTVAPPRYAPGPPPGYQEAISRSNVQHLTSTTTGTVPHIRGALRIMSPEQAAARRGETINPSTRVPGLAGVATRSRDTIGNNGRSGTSTGIERTRISGTVVGNGGNGLGTTTANISPRVMPATTTQHEIHNVPRPMCYFGLEYPIEGPRIYVNDAPGSFDALKRRGYVLKRKFGSLEAAQRWVLEFVPPTTTRNINPPRRVIDPPVPNFLRESYTPQPTTRERNASRRVTDPPLPDLVEQPYDSQFYTEPLVLNRRNRNVTSRQGVASRKGNSRQQRQERFVPVVHDLSILTGDGANSDDDESSQGEIYQSRVQVKRRPPSKPKGNARSWYGVERRSDSERAITNRLKTLRELQSGGFELKEVFPTKEEALDWLNELVIDTADADTNSSDDSDAIHFSNKPSGRRDRVPRVYNGGVPPTTGVATSFTTSAVPRVHNGGAPPTTGVAPSLATSAEPIKTTITLNGAEFFRAETAGSDPSIGNKEQIYNISYDNIDEMDIALCPPHMTTDERENFLDTVVDVTALPGMFRSTEGGDMMMDSDTATSIVATALGKKVSKTDVMWRTPGKNVLSRVKSQAQLEEMINGLERSGRIAFQQQEGRMRAVMYRCNYDRMSITLYLQAGLLPRMMRASHDRYIAMLYKARQKVISHGCWEGSLGYEMITHHARETLNLRIYSVDWRNFIIQTYVYLRDSERKSYVDETMYEGLFNRYQSPVDTPSTGRARNSNASDQGVNVCSHCRCHIGVAHPGGKMTCAFASLSPTQAKEAGRLFLVALNETPKMDKAKKIKELIAGMGGGK